MGADTAWRMIIRHLPISDISDLPDFRSEGFSKEVKPISPGSITVAIKQMAPGSAIAINEGWEPNRVIAWVKHKYYS